LSLALNRLNDLQGESKKKLTAQLKKFSKIFDRFDFGELKEESKRVAEYDCLEEADVKQVRAFAERLVESKKHVEQRENNK